MRSGRMLIIVGFLVLVGAAVIGGIMWMNRPTTEPDIAVPGEGTPDVYIPPEEKIEIVVAAQNVIPRGTRVTDDAVKLAEWPRESAPDGALTSIEDAVGRITREDIVLDTPLTDDVLTDSLPDLDSMGSDAALQIPKGMVAYALPVARYSSVAWALQPGDHVDVLISILIVELDEEFQAILPNQSFCVEPPEGEGCSSGTMGRLEVLANGWVVNMSPGEAQRPRLVTQLAVQDATVLRVGDWPGIEEVTPDEEVEPVAEEGVVAEPERARIEPLTLIVTPQDAMVLKYVEEIGASIDLILRSANDRDAGRITTESVTLQYIFDRFNIGLPPKLPYGVTPPVKSLRHNSEGGRLGTGSEILPEELIVVQAE